jgi:hypothetical protein
MLTKASPFHAAAAAGRFVCAGQVRNTLLAVGFAVMAAGNWVFASQLTANMYGESTHRLRKRTNSLCYATRGLGLYLRHSVIRACNAAANRYSFQLAGLSRVHHMELAR